MAVELELGQDWVTSQVDSFRKLAAAFYLP
jgi:hypothetical protein